MAGGCMNNGDTTAAKSIFTLVLPELSCARMARQQIFSHDRDVQAV
jgi:hypothetical protein